MKKGEGKVEEGRRKGREGEEGERGRKVLCVYVVDMMD